MQRDIGLNKPALVLDSNVVLNTWLFADTATLNVVMPLLHTHTWVCTPWMQIEATRVASSRALAKYTTPEKLAALAQGFAQHANLVADECIPTDIASGLLRCRDVDDQVFLNLALYTQAPLLLTLDRDLLKLKKRAKSLALIIVEPSKITL